MRALPFPLVYFAHYLCCCFRKKGEALYNPVTLPESAEKFVEKKVASVLFLIPSIRGTLTFAIRTKNYLIFQGSPSDLDMHYKGPNKLLLTDLDVALCCPMLFFYLNLMIRFPEARLFKDDTPNGQNFMGCTMM